MSLSHSDLVEIYKILWQMSFHFNYSLDELESMMPYERDVFVGFTLEHLQKKAEEASKQN